MTSPLSMARESGLAPWASNTHPSDVARRHIEVVATERHAYAIAQGGTMDGTNCRSPMSCGMSREGAFEQTWESNRAVRMENVGETDLLNPWLSNGRNDFRTKEEIAASAIAPGMSDGEKARALWFQEITHRYHFHGDNDELTDPVKVFNVYGHNTCGNDSFCLAALWGKAGLRVAPARLEGHCISQAFYDGRWNLLDGDLHAVYFLRDNRTLANDQDLARDHDLVKRTHTQGILLPESRALEEREASMYVFEGEIVGERRGMGNASMEMVLRPGEALTWRWGHLEPNKRHGKGEALYPDTLCNGLWEYRPDFSREFWRRGAAVVENIRSDHGGLSAEQGQTGVVVWKMSSPYIFVGGRLEIGGQEARFSLSWDGAEWQAVTGPGLDEFFKPDAPAHYGYFLRCQLTGSARLKQLSVINDIQMAPLALPGMVVGANNFVYSDQSPGPRHVRITHEWIERSAARPPEAPPAAVFPHDGGDTDGTDVVFRWQVSPDPGGHTIADYQFVLSDRPDMRWPLSMSFYKLISRTADRGHARYALPYPGLLTPETRYYWRVRAKNSAGVWGPWSKTWSFTPHGPAYPEDVVLDFDATKGLGVLRWKPNPVGRKPAKYRVYGSDEKGFSVSDEPYTVNVGLSKELSAQFPANFIAETSGTELAVMGAAVEWPNANRTYYRVVAVDEQGKRSGPSDYAAGPRPQIYSRPESQARVGVPYRYRVSVNRSLGDLRMRSVDGREVVNFWEVERPTFALRQGPQWLALDAATGMLSGTPDAAGKEEIVVEVALERDVRILDGPTLIWGREKVLSEGKERAGSATQRFWLEVTR